MGKFVLSLSLLGLSILLIFGIFAPNSPVMWLAATSVEYALIRVVLIAVLIGLLVTNPPRNILFRIVAGTIAMGVSGWALSETYQNHMGLLDTLAFLLVSVSTGLAILEPRHTAQRIKVQHPPSPTWHLDVVKL